MDHCKNCAQIKSNKNSIIPKHKDLLTVDTDVTKKSIKQPDCQQCNVDEKLRESQIRSLLAQIDKTPIKCPISECSQLIGITSVMRHFLRDHRTKIPVDFHECYQDEQINLRFNESTLKYNETVCLGVLAYGGNES